MLKEDRAFLSTWGGKLAAVAAPAMAILAAVATDPTAALLLSEFLPGPLRLLFVIGMVLVVYILPRFAQKKDKTDGE